MNREILNHQSITVLFDFMLSRLDDHASVDDLLTGFVSLLDKNLLSKSDQLQIVPKIIKEINVQNYPQNSRYNIFKIFALVLKNNLAEIKVAPLIIFRRLSIPWTVKRIRETYCFYFK
jgi:hypothetical protein